MLKKKKIQHPLPRSTPSATKWEIKIFHEWQATRRNKNCLEEQVGFKFDINKAQDLNYDVADMTVGSFNFWLTKFVEVLKMTENGTLRVRCVVSVVAYGYI